MTPATATACSTPRRPLSHPQRPEGVNRHYREAVLTAPRSGASVVYRPGAAGARRAAKPPGHIARAGEGSLSTSRSQRGKGEAGRAREARPVICARQASYVVRMIITEHGAW